MGFDPKAVIVERFVHEALLRFRGDEMQYLVTRDFRCHAWAALGFADGPKGACEFVSTLAAAFSDSNSRIEDIFVAGDKVTVRYVFDALHTGEIFGIPASGKRIVGSGIFVARLSGTQIAEIWRELDLLGMLRQMGAVEFREPIAA